MRTLNLFLLFFFFALNSYSYSARLVIVEYGLSTSGFFREIYWWVGETVCSLTYSLGFSGIWTGSCSYGNIISTGTIVFWLLLIAIVLKCIGVLFDYLNDANGE
tara:strand:+ start:171 stop:482 length:312 start_codon:yes stop_codon:yes gene_type:complete